MMMIRPATIDDAADIAEIHVRTWQSAYRGLLPDSALDAMDPDQRRPMWEQLVEAAPTAHRVLVAEGGETVIGFASFGPATSVESSASVFELFTIYVDPKVQRQGAGRGLLMAAEHEMRDAGAVSGQLWVLDGNEPAQRFY